MPTEFPTNKEGALTSLSTESGSRGSGELPRAEQSPTAAERGLELQGDSGAWVMAESQGSPGPGKPTGVRLEGGWSLWPELTDFPELCWEPPPEASACDLSSAGNKHPG